MDNINDLIYAYSLGCLDHEEHQKFVEYFYSGEEFNFLELGEYQNLASLLPSILTIETPDPQLKDKVAKKLYYLKDEIRAHRQKNKPSLKIQDAKKEELNFSGTEKPEDEITAGFEDQALVDQPIIKTSDFFSPPQNTQIMDREESNLNKPYNSEEKFVPEENRKNSSLIETEISTLENSTRNPILSEENNVQNIVGRTIDLTSKKIIPPTPPTKPVKKNYSIMIGGTVLFFLLVIGIIVTYLNITSKTNNLNNEVEKLKNEVGNLNIQLIGSQEIQEMLQSPDVQVINLRGENFNPNSFGKLIIGSDKGVGYIRFAQMPAIPENKLFQLWVSISGNFISLRTFKASDTLGFYSFKMLSLPKGDDISFRITEEPASGSTTPSDKVYLIGILNP
jgi:hypothetical protein